jgi:ABC-type Fe3+ transport system substrate-binding protein
MNHERRRLAWLSSLVLCLGLWGANVQATEHLVIISPHWEGMRFEFGRAFSDWHTAKFGEAVEIDWRDLGGASDDLKFVLSEFGQRPQGIGIDLFFGGGIDPYYEFAKRGLLDAYHPAEAVLTNIPASVGGVPIYDPEFHWFGVALSSFGILYNKRVLELNHWPVPDTWRDLAEYAPVGSVGLGDPRNSGTMHMMYEVILQRYGWAEGWRLITLLAAKSRGFDRAATATAKDVATGNVVYGLAIDFYAFAQIAAAGADNLGFVLPSDCVVINPDAVAILRGAPNRAVAERFIEFAISDTGQKLLVVPRGYPGGARDFSIERMSILPELYERYAGVTLLPINPFAQHASFHYDAAKGSARWGILNDLIGATLIDVYPELASAWKHGRGAQCGKPLLAEDAAERLAAGKWRDPLTRQRTLIEWQRQAQQQYERVAAASE